MLQGRGAHEVHGQGGLTHTRTSLFRPDSKTPPVFESVVVVIGGGPAGLMAARSLKKKGLSVAVLEHPLQLGRKPQRSNPIRC